MDDREVIEAFVLGGAVVGFGDRLHIDNECLLFDGWWHAVLRVSRDTFALRDEEPPEPTTFLTEVGEELRSRGITDVPADPTLLTVITYTSLDIGGLDWRIWSTDVATAEADLAFRVSRDAFFGDLSVGGDIEPNFAAGMGGLRRTAGLAPLVVVAVGLDRRAVDGLAAALPSCEVEARGLQDLEPEACHALTPNLVLVNATAGDGREFIRRFREGDVMRLLPVVALGGGDVAGADITVDPDASPTELAEHVKNLLP